MKKIIKFFVVSFITLYIMNFFIVYETNANEKIIEKNNVSLQCINGVWRRVVNGSIDYNYTGIAENKYGLWYLEKGKITFVYKGTYWDGEKGYIIEGSKVRATVNKNTTGVMKIDEVWRMVKNGVVDYNYNGLGDYKNGIWYIQDGAITFKYNGVYVNKDGGMYVIENSKFNPKAKGIYNVKKDWLYFENGKYNGNYTGIASNKHGEWLIEKGKITFVYKGTYWVGEKGYVIEGSKVRATVNKNTTEVMKIDEVWRMVKNGVVDYNYNGLGDYKNGIWYIQDGAITFKYNGVYVNKDGEMYVIENSKFNPKAKGIYNVKKDWLYFENGKYNGNYTGIASNKHGEWLIEKGKITFVYKGTYWIGEKGYIIEGSKVRAKVNKNTTEVMKIDEIWRMVKNGVVDYNYNGIGNNKNGKWLIQDGKVTFSYNGNYKDSAGNVYGLRGSKVETIIINVNHPGDMKIESPKQNAKYSTSNITVSGWAVSKDKNDIILVYLDGKKLGKASRNPRNDVNTSKYGGKSSNENPGFSYVINTNLLNNGNHRIKVENTTSDGKEVIQSREVEFVYKKEVEFQEGTYGSSGLKVKGDSRGQSLKYYKIGNGPNVYFATFAVHGWEDLYKNDGKALTKIAEEFKNKLIEMQDENLSKKWTIYIFPAVNPDGENYGWTHNGPGRTSLYSSASKHKGIDINRCWSTGYTKYTGDRNYNGTEPFQSYEAKALRDFLLAKRSTKGQTILVDLHGWLNETIGDNKIGSYYRSQYGISKHIDTYGKGYLVNWARSNLGYNGRTARSALVELPPWNTDSSKYINGTINMLRNIL